MIYCSIDVETTGLNPDRHEILSIGVIIEDTIKKLSFDEIPKFNGLIISDELHGQPQALSLNKNIIDVMAGYMKGDNEVKRAYEIHSGYTFHHRKDISKEIYKFILNNTTTKTGDIPINSQTKPVLINVAGKNFQTFDKLFLEKLPWWQHLINVRQRIIDPAILCCQWNTDETLPSLFKCKQRLLIEGDVTHDALMDAWDVIQILRKFY